MHCRPFNFNACYIFCGTRTCQSAISKLWFSGSLTSHNKSYAMKLLKLALETKFLRVLYNLHWLNRQHLGLIACSSKICSRFLQWFFCYLRAASNFTCDGAVFFTHFSPYHFQLQTTASTVVMLAYFCFILCRFFLDNIFIKIAPSIS